MRIAFVSAPAGNAFMAEILAAVAQAVRDQGADAVVHQGTVDDVDDGATAFVVIPHEYFWFNPRPSAARLRRTIAFGVEHPGTDTFTVAARAGAVMAARFEISTDSVAALTRHGLPAEHFVLGYSRHWDAWAGRDDARPVDLAYMGAADPERLQALATLAPGLTGLSTELLIPPIEQRLRPRPDFLMGEAKWRFLARTKVLLNLHRQAKTALELVRTLEAICNGCVLLTEPSTDLGGLEPGRHLLVAPRQELAVHAQAAVGDPGRLRTIAAQAYEFCQRELDMGPSAQRLAAVAEELVRTAGRGAAAPGLELPDWSERRPPYVPELARWIPQPYPLPPVGVSLPEPPRQAVRDLAVERRRKMALNDIYSTAVPAGAAEVDAIVVAHAGSGPLEPTQASLAAQGVTANVHVAGLGIGRPADLSGVATYLTCTAQTSIGAARNELIERSSAPYLLVLEAGDVLLGEALAAMVDALRDAPQAAVAYPIAAYGEETLVNLFHPEPERLAHFAYLTRGYLLRRSWLHTGGMFAEDPVLDAYVDHDFWGRAARTPQAASHLHRIGARLWRTDLAKMMPTDPAEVWSMFELRAGEVA